MQGESAQWGRVPEEVGGAVELGALPELMTHVMAMIDRSCH